MTEIIDTKLNTKNTDITTNQVITDYTRDEWLTDYAKATLDDRYLLPNEKPQDLFARVANTYGDNQEHAQRLYDYMSKTWFMPLPQFYQTREQCVDCQFLAF